MVRPAFLNRGDWVGIASPAKLLEEGALDPGLNILESWGLSVTVGEHAYHRYHQFAGSDKERILDFQKMIDDPRIKAIFCARGGYGSSRILDDLNFEPLQKDPKWVIGFSDITVFLCQLNVLGIQGIHGPMPAFFEGNARQESVKSLKKALFGDPLYIQAPLHALNRPGNVEGELVGGNLSLICHLLGTATELDTAGKILFLEEIEEDLYRFDRMMVQLKRAGKLRRIVGLIIGQFSQMKDNRVPFGRSAPEIILDHLNVEEIPVGLDFPIGHEPDNRALYFGGTGSLSVGMDGSRLDFKPH